jgi:hypothetical protein
VADSQGGGVFGLLLRIVCVAGGAVIGALVLAVLAPGAGTAHADPGIEPAPAGGSAAVDHDSDAGALWAQPESLSSAAARRAVVVTADAGADPWVVTPRPTDDAPSAPAVAAHWASAGAGSSIPIGTFGPGGGSADGGPSISHVAAVLSAALAAVLWLSQRLRHGEVRARSAFVTLSLERPG